MTKELRYSIDLALTFFGKDILKNIHGMCTHTPMNQQPNARKIFKMELIDSIFKFENGCIFPAEQDEIDDEEEDIHEMNRTMFEWGMK